MANRLSRKVRRLPIIISFSLMRCLLSLPKVISCQSKCTVWPELDALLTELEENKNPVAGGDASLLRSKRMPERWCSPVILPHTNQVQQVWSSTEPGGVKTNPCAYSVWQVCVASLSFRKRCRLNNSPYSSAPVIPPQRRMWTAAKGYLYQGDLLPFISSKAFKPGEFKPPNFCSV